jgi:type IV pilus assembly protein PilB
MEEGPAASGAAHHAKPASLAQMLIEAGVLSADQIMKVQEIARRERQSLGRILVRNGLILFRDLATLTAVYLGLSMVDLLSETIDPQAISLIPEDAARK